MLVTKGIVIRPDQDLAGGALALPTVPCLQVIIDLGVPLYNDKNSLKDWCYQVQMALKSLGAHGWSDSSFELSGKRLYGFFEEASLASTGHDLFTAFMSLQQFASDTVTDHPLSDIVPQMFSSTPSFADIRIVAVWHDAAYHVAIQSNGKNLVGPDMDLAMELLHYCSQKELVINGKLYDRLTALASRDASEMEMLRDVLGACEKLMVGQREQSFYRTHDVSPGKLPA